METYIPEMTIQRLEDYIKKTQRKTDYSHQKQYRQHKHQQNKNHQKTKMGRKMTMDISSDKQTKPHT